LCFEVGFFGYLLTMQNEIDEETRIVNQSRKINYSLHRFIRGMAIIAAVARDATYKGFRFETYDRLRKDMRQCLTDLKSLYAGDPDKLVRIKRCEMCMESADKDMAEAKAEFAHILPFEYPLVSAKYSKRMNDNLLLVAKAGIFELADESAALANQDVSARKREQILLLLKCALVISVVLAIVIATVISKQLTSKLMILRDNAGRLARGQALLEPLKGNDEISQVDRSFHYAVNQIEKGIRKEQAILENAGDLICAFDEKLKVQSINPAGEVLLKLDSDAIVGVSFLNFIKDIEKEHVDKMLADIKEKGSREELETVLQGAPATEVEAILSVSYSTTDKAFYAVAHDVTAKKQLENVKREVTAMITHDLKTPLQTVRNYLEMLQLGKFGELNERGKKFLSLTDRESDRMVNLIESVLQLEQLRSGSIKLKREQVPLKSIVQKSIEAVQLLANDKGISLSSELIDIEVLGEAKWIEQILVNIFANAINYSPKDSSVKAVMQQQGEFAEVRIKDDGPGISDEDKGLIFERFHRISKQAQKVAGSGLGLTICKELIDLHGGYIKVESKLGEGSTFILGFPLKTS